RCRGAAQQRGAYVDEVRMHAATCRLGAVDCLGLPEGKQLAYCANLGGEEGRESPVPLACSSFSATNRRSAEAWPSLTMSFTKRICSFQNSCGERQRINSDGSFAHAGVRLLMKSNSS